jgi:multidrug efflux pump subunit AcrB
VLIELAPTEERRLDSETILAAWAEQVGVIDDALSVSFERVERGPTEKPIDVRLLGDDLEQLRAAADEVTARLSQTAGVTGVGHDLLPGRREVRVSLKPLARTLGVTLEDLARQLRTGFYGGEAVRVQRGSDEVRVQVRYPDAERQSIADVESMRIGTTGGQSIRFSEVADYRLERGYATIYRQEGLKRVKINADVDERVTNAEQVLAHLNRDLLQQIPARFPGVQVRLEGQHAEIVESVRSLFFGFLVALVAIYACLAAMLRSYAQPCVIMFNIPLAFVGAVLGHWVLGQDLTMISLFGMVTLAGVVANDSMALVDQINVSIREGEPVREAVLRCGQRRFRAVMNTFVTTVAGVAPLMLERSTQAQSLMPMVITITFGLSFATLLAMFMVPATYLTTNDLKRFARWLRRGGEYPTPESVEYTPAL